MQIGASLKLCRVNTNGHSPAIIKNIRTFVAKHIALRLFGILIKIRNLESAKALIWVAFYSKHLFFFHCIAFDLQVRITRLSCMQHDNCAFLFGKTALSLILN